ncbi:MAG: serine hydrolase [Chloroflexi bacterium]|uniref:serine hydrolase n=1 Tax=Candidatus Flexifilum breve TaxID=3140694 RepID=UPI003135FF69|nr:serine hydrolase [Chloroflexota bacterium]
MVSIEQAREQLASIDAWVQSEIDAGHTPAAAVGIIVNGEVVFKGGFGLRDRERGLPVDSDTVFAIGSCSKAFTALGIGLLVDDGKTTWDTRIRDVIPEFRLYDPIATELSTFRDLLSHRTGLPRHDAMWYGSTDTREGMIARLRHHTPTATFRERFQYQNLMFMTAGYAAGKIAGMSWEDLTQTRILDPLGMKRSTFTVSHMEADANAARPYSYRNGGFELVPYRNLDALAPAGAINSNIDDLIPWLRLNMQGDETIIKDATRRELVQPHTVIPDSPMFPWYGSSEITHTTYALGWAASTYRGHTMIRHNGGIDGFNSSIAFLPHQGIGVIVLCNTQEREPAGVTMFGIVDRLLGLEPLPWWDRFEQVAEMGRKQLAEHKQKLITERHADAKISHPLADYAGTYHHAGYGDMVITLDGDKLGAVYGGLTLHLTPHHYDHFMVEVDNEPDLFFVSSFFSDEWGNIQRFTCQLEPALEATEFMRVVEK